MANRLTVLPLLRGVVFGPTPVESRRGRCGGTFASQVGEPDRITLSWAIVLRLRGAILSCVREPGQPTLALSKFHGRGHALEPSIIVMIIMLSMPNGDSGVHVKPFATVETCIEAANVEASDPFVRNVECAKLDDGLLTLRFDREKARQGQDIPPEVAARGAS